MSELGSVNHKSLLARFDENNIVRVIEAKASSRCFINYEHDGKTYAAPIATNNGALHFPSLVASFVNTTASAITVNAIFESATKGIKFTQALSIPANSSETASIVYQFEDGVYLYKILTTATVSIDLAQNCFLNDDGNIQVIDPFETSTCVLNLS